MVNGVIYRYRYFYGYIENRFECSDGKLEDFDLFLLYHKKDIIRLLSTYYYGTSLYKAIDIEDIEQEIVMKIVIVLRKCNNCYNYCLVSIENMLIDMLKKHNGRSRIEFENSMVLNSLYGGVNKMDESIKFEQLVHRLIMDVDLTKREGVVFMYHMAMGVSQTELAEQLRISVETVKRDKKNIINKMKSYFKYTL